MTRPRALAQRLTLRLAALGLAGSIVLLLFVGLNADELFDRHYKLLGLTGLAYEIGDHVIVPLLVLIAPAILVTPWVIRRSLSPLEAAAARIDAARGSRRGFRVQVADLPAEVVPFASAVNSLLERLDKAAERQESFAADVAHELKTPLAVLALELEQLDDDRARQLVRDVTALNRLIEQLLLLAQLDADAAARVRHDDVPLAAVATDVAELLAPLAVAEGRTLAVEEIEPAVVRGRREAVSAALRNLVENALRVTPRGGTVTIVVGPGSQLRVRDGGPGLDSERLVQLCTRFRRADYASRYGAGLGLAIVSRIMAAHGGVLATQPDASELQLIFERRDAEVAHGGAAA